MQKIPVTIISGFLGAGKTTLLNHLVESHPDKKFAIIENEFGDIPIDQELVVNAEDGIFEMSNGCVCCSLNSELGELLEKLVKGNYTFNHLLIETTGIAEPDGVAATFIRSKNTTFYLDGTICLADSKFIIKNLKQRGETVKQISFADAILLNKADLVSADEYNEAEEAIRIANPDAPIYKTIQGKTEEPIELLDLNAFDSNRVEKFLSQHHHHHDHSDLVSHSFRIESQLDSQKFEHWMSALLQFNGNQVYRIKGILNFFGEDHKIIFQSVRSESKVDLSTKWKTTEPRESRLVFIGYGVKREVLEKGLNNCIFKL